MASTTHFRASAACRIAEISPSRFNEAVAAGNYPCAPGTDRGSPRIFQESDLIALYIYGRLIGHDYPPRIAGNFACKVREQLERDPGAAEIVVVREMAGQTSVFSARPGVRVTPSGRGQNILQRIAFDIENVRRLVRDEMQKEAATVGEEDEE